MNGKLCIVIVNVILGVRTCLHVDSDWSGIGPAPHTALHVLTPRLKRGDARRISATGCSAVAFALSVMDQASGVHSGVP